MKHLINAVEKIAKENPDGFTVTVPNLENVTSGYIAAYFETQNSFNREGLEKVINHSLENGQTVGGWLDTESNLFYYDRCGSFETEVEIIKN